MSVYDTLGLVNYGFVLFFGVIVSLYLADIKFKGNEKIYIFIIFLFGLGQALFYIVFGSTLLYKFYPLLIHIPLAIIIKFIFKRGMYISLIAVLAAYLLCTPRKWFGTFASYFMDYSPAVADIASIIITIPFLYIIIRYISPYIIKLKYENKSILILFLVLLSVYYVLEYGLTVYTNLLYSGGAVVADFMDSFIVLMYFIFSILLLEFSSQKNKMERKNIILSSSAAQAQKEVAQLLRSERQTAIYRHDLRHHMNFIKGCLTENKIKDAQDYINEICEDIERLKIKKYCENQSVNLIFSSYAEKAENENIKTNISVTATDFSRFQITDICSLFSNALENAINACMDMENKEKCYINAKIYDKNNRLCINIANSYEKEPVFENEVPVSYGKNHGIGVKSMISVVEKYDGVYRFFANDREFKFQASM